MRKGFLGVIGTLAVSASAALAQYPYGYYPQTGYYPASYGYYPQAASYYGYGAHPYAANRNSYYGYGYGYGAYPYNPYYRTGHAGAAPTYSQPVVVQGSPAVHTPTTRAQYSAPYPDATVSEMAPAPSYDVSSSTVQGMPIASAPGTEVGAPGCGCEHEAHGPVTHVPDACGHECCPAPDYCAAPCCQAPCCCACVPRFWASADYLLWWISNAPIGVPLVTTGPDSSEGILGRPGASVLFGDEGQTLNPMSGGRLTIGGWLDCKGKVGLEASGFVLGRQSFAYDAVSSGFPLLAVPFFDIDPANTGPASIVLAGLGSTGGPSISGGSRLWGADATLLCNVCRGCKGSFDLLCGFRYLHLDEDLNMSFNSIANGVIVTATDNFETENRFYGGFVGARGTLYYHKLFVSLMGRIALGNNQQIVQIAGVTTAMAPPFIGIALPGGIFAQPTNIGTHEDNQFTAVPEAQLMVGFDLTKHLRLFGGYNFLYWANVVRPGNQIDANINGSQLFGGTLVGLPAPLPEKTTSNFFAHGLSVGAEIRY